MAPILFTATSQLPLESNTAQILHLLQRCSNMEELKQIHGQMLKTGLILNEIPASKLLAFCASANSGNLAYARMVFDRIQRPNTFMWNTMMGGYSNSKEPEQALHIYHQMFCHSVPHNAYTFPFQLKVCSSMPVLEETNQIHAHIIKMGFGSEIYTMNSLLNVYAKSVDMKYAHLLFDQEAWNLLHRMQVGAVMWVVKRKIAKVSGSVVRCAGSRIHSEVDGLG